MNYLFLAISLFSGVAKGYVGKKTSGLVSTMQDSIYISTVRFLMCVVISAGICLFGSGFSLSGAGLMICALSGVSQALFVTTWLMAVRSGAYMMVEVFLTLGIILPSVLCNIIFKESISLFQWGGFAMLIVAAYIMCTYNNSIKAKISAKSYVILASCGMANGLCDFTQKLFVKTQDGYAVSAYNLYSYAFSAVVLALILLCDKVLLKKTVSKNCSVKSFGGYVFVMAVCLFLYSFFKTLAGKTIPAIVMYPICQGASMILSMLMAHFIFKERINKRGILGVVLAFASLMVITLSQYFA